MAKLDNVFDSTLRDIEYKLNQDLISLKSKKRTEYFNGIPKLKEKQKELDKTKNKIKELQKKEDELLTDIRNLDPTIPHGEVSKLISEENLYLNYSDNKKSDIEVARTIAGSKELNNYRAFGKIKAQMKSQFNLAITQKQKQQVIMNLQTSVDWKSLDINIPNMFEINKVEVKDGAIIINNALPNLNK